MDNARALKLLMAFESLNQKATAERLKCSEAKLSAVLNRRTNCNDAFRKTICEAFDVTPKQFELLASASEDLSAYDSAWILDLLRKLFSRASYVSSGQSRAIGTSDLDENDTQGELFR